MGKKRKETITSKKEKNEYGEEKKIQWHPAFVSAMKLEYKNYAENLSFENEYHLNSLPLEVDLLLIKKKESLVQNDAIGSFFKKHNLIEYKGIGDSLNLNVYVKGIAYAYLYKCYETDDDRRELEDITLSFVREARPFGLMSRFSEIGVEFKCKEPGIYLLENAPYISIQIIVLREIGEYQYPWLTSLTKTMDEKKASYLIKKEFAMTSKWEKENAEAVLQVAMTANKKVFERIKKGDGTMCQAMWELMKPEIDAAMKEIIEEKDSVIEEKDSVIEEKDAEIERLKNELLKRNIPLA